MLWKQVRELENSVSDDKLTLKQMIATMDVNFGPKNDNPLTGYKYELSPFEKLCLILHHLRDVEDRLEKAFEP